MSDTKFKSKIKAEGGLNLPTQTADRVIITNGSGDLASTAVTTTEIGYVSGLTSAVQTQLNAKINSSEKGAANGVATLDGSGKLPSSQLTIEAFEYKGNYNATTNSPTLVDGTGNTGDIYHVNVAGTQDFGSGNIVFVVGDKAVYDGTVWQKWDLTDSVASVFGRTGAVTAQSADYSAAQITNTPAGNIAATDVQAAINELDSEKQPLDATLTSLAAFNTNGLLTQTAADTFTARTITGTASNISVTNGSGVAGDPTLDLIDTAVTPGSFGAADSTLTATVDQKGRLTALAASAISILASQVSNFAASVRSTVLTGFSAGPNSPVAATDTVLEGLQKLQAQVSAVAPTAGDIGLTDFAGANNQAAAANVTGLAFAAGSVRSAKVLVSISVDATVDLYEAYELLLVNNGTTFNMAQSSTGDDSLVVFSVTSGGQIQYTSGNYAGFTSLEISFRAIVTLI